MTFKISRILSLSFVAACLGISGARAEAPAGWFRAGSAPSEYVFSQSATASSGKYGALITAKTGKASGFGTLMQTITAENYRGARWRLSGSLKTEQAGRAQMWMRVDGPEGKILAFDNMDARAVTGTTDWKRYEIVLDVPSNSINIAFGFFLAQAGKVWGDNFKLEKVDASVPVTSMLPIGGPALPRAPANPDFER